jgi:hypothetical protein
MPPGSGLADPAASSKWLFNRFLSLLPAAVAPVQEKESIYLFVYGS